MKDDATLISEVLEKIPNKYLAVIVASKRARAINEGFKSLVKTDATKPTTVALEEIAARLIIPGPVIPAIEEAKSEEEKEPLPSPEVPDETPEDEGDEEE